MTKRIYDSLFLKALTQEASKIAEKAKQNANWSSDIPGAIRVEPAEVDSAGNYSVNIVVNLSEDGAPMAAAFEYGSGVHGEKGKKYVIDPKEGNDHLAFPLSRWPNYMPPPNVSRGFRFPGTVSRKAFVMHPGVRARPFLRPAIEANKPSLRARFLRVFKRGFLDSINVVFHDIQTK
jgi:hypothetical protein